MNETWPQRCVDCGRALPNGRYTLPHPSGGFCCRSAIQCAEQMAKNRGQTRQARVSDADLDAKMNGYFTEKGWQL